MPALWLDRRLASDADRRACRSLIRSGSKTFAAASLLLPSRLRQAAHALYAFCRLSDDLVDIDGGALAAIAQLRERLDRAYAGRPADHPVDRSFADVVVGFDVPRALPEALIDGLAWDVAGVACEELSDLRAYAARVAGSVGAMMTVLMGVRDRDTLARACDLGVAMQLTNVARDVGEDARAGRLYLPRAWLQADGLDPERWLAAPSFTPEIGAAVARLIEAADELYRRAAAGIAGLPVGCRPGIMAASLLYREIGVEVARRGYDSVAGRARVATGRKLGLVTRALGAAPLGGAVGRDLPAVPEAAFLVDAVTAAGPQPAAALDASLGFVSRRVLWIADLFAALEARDRLPERA
jgi:phytoene synthase